jgi:hypothetical protein
LQEQKVVMLNPAMVTMSRTIFNHIKSELETDVRAALAGRETDPAKLRYAQELHKVRESTSTSTLEQHSAWIPGAKRPRTAEKKRPLLGEWLAGDCCGCC